ncbi:hypothetical protein SASPL_150311 [Salvia splendens]|uniref:2Fe-2S ferredoxin-type domain-containing protein n=2 Tax=Salvia TaxID=21880 RepID=A0A8X8W5S7_SALSN|nr:hypothetical protein SASPL_150311 [Salvia splendens]
MNNFNKKSSHHALSDSGGWWRVFSRFLKALQHPNVETLDEGGSTAGDTFSVQNPLFLLDRLLSIANRAGGGGGDFFAAVAIGIGSSLFSLVVVVLTQKFSSVVSNSMAHTQYLKTQSHASFCTSAAKLDSEEGDEEPQRINVTFVDKDGEEKHISVPEGFSMLEAAHDNDIDLEGACEGTMACSTCHVIVMDEDQYNKLPDPVDEELDMLDLAFGLTKTSRLGCQVIAKRELDGLRLALPSATS